MVFTEESLTPHWSERGNSRFPYPAIRVIRILAIVCPLFWRTVTSLYLCYSMDSSFSIRFSTIIILRRRSRLVFRWWFYTPIQTTFIIRRVLIKRKYHLFRTKCAGPLEIIHVRVHTLYWFVPLISPPVQQCIDNNGGKSARYSINISIIGKYQ